MTDVLQVLAFAYAIFPRFGSVISLQCRSQAQGFRNTKNRVSCKVAADGGVATCRGHCTHERGRGSRTRSQLEWCTSGVNGLQFKSTKPHYSTVRDTGVVLLSILHRHSSSIRSRRASPVLQPRKLHRKPTHFCRRSRRRVTEKGRMKPEMRASYLPHCRASSRTRLSRVAERKGVLHAVGRSPKFDTCS